MIGKILSDKGVMFEKIKSSILKIRNHKQIGPTVKWIHLFSKEFNDKDLTNELAEFLDWNGDNYKL